MKNKNTNSKRDMDLAIKEIKASIPKILPAIKHLRKVTGKFGTQNIDPLEEKRWSKTCWEAWELLNSVSLVLDEGRPSIKIIGDIIVDINPTGTWKGKVVTDCKHNYEHINNLFPDLSGCWKNWKPRKNKKKNKRVSKT